MPRDAISGECDQPGCEGDARYAPPGRGHTCTDSFGNVVIVEPSRPTPEQIAYELATSNPCAVAGHRPAYLNGGGIACGVCGVPM